LVAAKKMASSDKSDASGISSRSERLLAILVLEAISKNSDLEKAVLLSSVGFTNSEVANLLGTSAHTVGQHLYKSRSRKGSRKRVAKRTKESR
jgi:DNA-binding CsgD family transcriptional regulator